MFLQADQYRFAALCRALWYDTRSRSTTVIGRVPGECARAYEPLDSAERAALHHIRAAAHRVTESETLGELYT